MPQVRSLTALLAFLLAALFCVPAEAQQARNHIAAELVAEGPAAPGGKVQFAIAMRPEKGWHGYWSNPGDAGLGMQLDWSLPPGWQAGTPEYPVPRTLLISGLMNHVYEGPYAVLVPLSVPRDAAPGGRLPVTLEAQWLACTDEICVPERGTLAAIVTVGASGARDPRFDGWRADLPPLLDREGSFASEGGGVRIAIPLPVSFELQRPHLFLATENLIDYAAPQRFLRDGNRLVVELKRRAGAAAAPGSISGILKLDDKGNGVSFVAKPGEVPAGGTPIAGEEAAALPASLWSLLLAALAGGLLLNVMPCVFPILSLKALSLARAGESEAEARREGLAYTAGVVLACLALGALMLALRAAGNEIGWAFQLQEPGVVVGLLLLACAIAVNLAGLYELPSLSLTRGGKPLGAFATGLLAAFVATPCTGPFMAAAMGAALLLPPLEALLLFAALGLGIALPFLALGFLPPLRRMLPRPGRWMETFRRIMAVPMALTAFALLWLAWRLGGTAYAAIAGVAAVVLVIVLALAGMRRRSGGKAGPILLTGLAPVALACLLVLPRLYAPSSHQEGGIILAQPFSEAALAEARASGKPVFVWFTADWCLTCKVNESVAIEREETREAFGKAGVIALRGDWTRRDPAITRFLTRHGAAGVPLYLWYPAGGDARQLPQVLTPESLVRLAEERSPGPARAPSGLPAGTSR